jgi:hypothetical protein
MQVADGYLPGSRLWTDGQDYVKLYIASNYGTASILSTQTIFKECVDTKLFTTVSLQRGQNIKLVSDGDVEFIWGSGIQETEDETGRRQIIFPSTIRSARGEAIIPFNYEETKNFSDSVEDILSEIAKDINGQFPDIKPFRFDGKDQRFKFNTKNIKEWIGSCPYADKWMRTDKSKSFPNGQISLKIDAFTHRNGRTARMQEKGQALVLTEAGRDLLDYMDNSIPEFKQKENISLHDQPKWDTLYFSGGKKEKINKIDLVGFLGHIGGLKKDEIGLITVLDHWSFVAVSRGNIRAVLQKVRNEKIKGKRLKIAIAR